MPKTKRQLIESVLRDTKKVFQDILLLPNYFALERPIHPKVQNKFLLLVQMFAEFESGLFQIEIFVLPEEMAFPQIAQRDYSESQILELKSAFDKFILLLSSKIEALLSGITSSDSQKSKVLIGRFTEKQNLKKLIEIITLLMSMITSASCVCYNSPQSQTTIDIDKTIEIALLIKKIIQKIYTINKKTFENGFLLASMYFYLVDLYFIKNDLELSKAFCILLINDPKFLNSLSNAQIILELNLKGSLAKILIKQEKITEAQKVLNVEKYLRKIEQIPSAHQITHKIDYFITGLRQIGDYYKNRNPLIALKYFRIAINFSEKFPTGYDNEQQILAAITKKNVLECYEQGGNTSLVSIIQEIKNVDSIIERLPILAPTIICIDFLKEDLANAVLTDLQSKGMDVRKRGDKTISLILNYRIDHEFIYQKLSQLVESEQRLLESTKKSQNKIAVHHTQQEQELDNTPSKAEPINHFHYIAEGSLHKRKKPCRKQTRHKKTLTEEQKPSQIPQQIEPQHSTNEVLHIWEIAEGHRVQFPPNEESRDIVLPIKAFSKFTFFACIPQETLQNISKPILHKFIERLQRDKQARFREGQGIVWTNNPGYPYKIKISGTATSHFRLHGRILRNGEEDPLVIFDRLTQK